VSAAPAKKPIVTANQVTFARLALLPLGSWMMYQGVRGQWIALVFMTVVGCTDFVDGWLARKYGPTVLGGLMDPIADKVFVAVTFLPMIELGWLPWYVVGLIFVREFAVTALRSSYERRAISLKSSYLAKVKTWFQMCGGGMIFMFRTVERAWVMDAICLALAAGPVVFGLLYYLVKKRRWRGAVVFAISFGALAACQIVFGPKVTSVVLGWAMVAITWASGAAYLQGIPALHRALKIDAEDVARLIGAIALPSLAVIAVRDRYAWSWPLTAALALEFAIGGLDNLLAHHREQPGALGSAVRAIAQAALVGAAIYGIVHRLDPQLVYAAYAGAFAVTLTATALLFWRHRAAYLGQRAEVKSTASTAPASWI
jgi:CDP-diacylglycerol--glycerol-3-phosphate 3-phosphatidyltransferase